MIMLSRYHERDIWENYALIGIKWSENSLGGSELDNFTQACIVFFKL